MTRTTRAAPRLGHHTASVDGLDVLAGFIAHHRRARRRGPIDPGSDSR
jgi:hypothetical protein